MNLLIITILIIIIIIIIIITNTHNMIKHIKSEVENLLRAVDEVGLDRAAAAAFLETDEGVDDQ